jgi:predicted neuraminidase
MKTMEQKYLVLLLAASLVVPAFAAEDPSKVSGKEIVINTSTNIETYRVFGYEHPGLYKHPASITELANGDIYIAYYGGENEYSSGTAVYGSRLKVGETQWTPPVAIADTPFRGDGNPVVWQAPDGLVWLFYVNRYGDTWSNARVKAKVSEDGAQTWSDSFMLTMEEGTMARGKPIVLMNGDYLLPMYHETGEDREKMDASTCSFFLRYNPKTQEWTETNRIYSELGNLQPQVAQLDENNLIAYMRRGGGYGPESSGFIQYSESKDGGYTWSQAVDTEFPNPNSAVDVVKLKNGHLVLVYNDHTYNRSPLTVAVSTDNGKTYPYRRQIGGGDNSYAYPYVIQTRDDKIRVLYTTNGRSTIMVAVFDEAAIVEWARQH